MIKNIESTNNPYIKDLLKLHDKKHREATQQFLIEGYNLVNEAKESKLLTEVLITDEIDYIDGVENILVSKQIIEKLSFTKAPQNIIGVCKYFEESEIVGKKILLLDDVQDPGNLGTLVRSSLGFNIDLVVLSSSSVDIYNDKFIRATQGAIFKIKIVKRDLIEVINLYKELGITIIGTSINSGIRLQKLNKYDQFALILGNEGNGIKNEILNSTDFNVFIETNSLLESLNVAVAGSIMYYLSN